jgi:DNA-binding IclR family transcriptional regulator
VAAPIRDYTGRAIAAISISMREEPCQERLDMLVPLVTGTAMNISSKLGFQTSSSQAILDLAIH